MLVSASSQLRDGKFERQYSVLRTPLSVDSSKVLGGRRVIRQNSVKEAERSAHAMIQRHLPAIESILTVGDRRTLGVGLEVVSESGSRAQATKAVYARSCNELPEKSLEQLSHRNEVGGYPFCGRRYPAYVHGSLWARRRGLIILSFVGTPVRTPAETRLVLPPRTDIERNRRHVRDSAVRHSQYSEGEPTCTWP